ncbi:unnamed protein product [Calypogeia fissa]
MPGLSKSRPDCYFPLLGRSWAAATTVNGFMPDRPHHLTDPSVKSRKEQQHQWGGSPGSARLPTDCSRPHEKKDERGVKAKEGLLLLRFVRWAVGLSSEPRKEEGKSERDEKEGTRRERRAKKGNRRRRRKRLVEPGQKLLSKEWLAGPCPALPSRAGWADAGFAVGLGSGRHQGRRARPGRAGPEGRDGGTEERKEGRKEESLID